MARLAAGLASDLRLFRVALAASLGTLLLRIHIAKITGFGDSEALYASYALFPQPAYLDHPGLVGALARWVGDGTAPEPHTAHIFTSCMATLVPWIGLAAARAAGASWRGSLGTALTLALVPELSIGLYGMTPDLPLAMAWLGALLLAAMALRAEPKSFRALWTTLGVGVLVGAACLAKASGVLLGVALLATSLTRPVRGRYRTLGPWCALAVGLVLVSPVVSWELREGFPMLRHRFITTQVGAGLSLRNLGILAGGQLAYVTPPLWVGAALVFHNLWQRRHADAVGRLLWLSTVVVAAPLLALCLWSPAAEPHWLAPAYLPLSIHLARCQAIGRRLAAGALATGAVVTLAAWAWVSTPLPLRLLGGAYRARYDIANDLHAWGPGRRLVLDAISRAISETRRIPVVVGPHWIVCAQVKAVVKNHVAVGCNTPVPDDFDRWLPRARWLAAPVLLFVHDSRFELDPSEQLPRRRVTSLSKVDIRRDGQVVRTIHVTRLEHDSATAGR